VFGIRDPYHPAEVAYVNPPPTSTPNAAMSAPAFVPEGGEIAYTDGNYDALKVTKGAWPS
jgi:hypothetical protein